MAKKQNLDFDVAAILNICTISETLHSLPRSGGLLDQDSLFITLYMTYLEAKSKREELDRVEAERKQPRMPKAGRGR